LVSGLRSDTAPAISAENKELSHIPDVLVARDAVPLSDKDETCQLAIDLQEERVAIRLDPVERKVAVAEPAVWSDVQIDPIGELVDIKLKEICEDRLMIPRCGDKFNLRGGIVWRPSHFVPQPEG
jgi:hypothetical protein